jgi:hypothetical protein
MMTMVVMMSMRTLVFNALGAQNKQVPARLFCVLKRSSAKRADLVGTYSHSISKSCQLMLS